MAKLKSTSHSNPLPSSKSPFAMVHIDILQVTPVSWSSYKYILVLINNFLQWNYIYLLQKKHKCKSRIISVVKEIQNHLHVMPAILHTDCGGEFSFAVFKSFLSESRISLEQGPANSPQTSGSAKQF
jgi:hypothetical protein